MKILYLECNMGAAGDMLMSALLELHPDPDDFLKRLNALNLPNVSISRKSAVKCGITGTHVEVLVGGEAEGEDMHRHEHEHHHHHHHTGLAEIEAMIKGLSIPEKVKEDAVGVYSLIAKAESIAHAAPIENIHFHEVGTMDAVADVVGVSLLMYELAPDKTVASPVRVGSGSVRCAHGILPVPAPATAYILRGVPIYAGEISGELCTPTGGALLKHFADEFAPMPLMRPSKIGCGMGTKDFEAANCLRAFLGEGEDEPKSQIVEINVNIDDMTAEEIGFATERIFEAGALDVFTTPVGMKKNRPATMITCLCSLGDRERVLAALFKHTSTIGVREHICSRHTLNRREKTLQTPYGSVKVKHSRGLGIERVKPEYDDLVRIARENNASVDEIKRKLELIIDN